MLYQLNHFYALAGVVVALVGGLYVHDAVLVLVGRALGDRVATGSGRLTWRIAPHLEVYGAVCAVVAGYGWGAPVPVDDRWRGRRRRVVLTLLAGPLTYAVLATAALGAYRGAGSGSLHLRELLVAAAATWAGQAVLSLIPLPPVLDGGRALFAWAPVTHGWQQARYQLIERNFGLFIAIALVIVPRITSLPNPVGDLGGFVDSSTGDIHGQLLQGLAHLVGL